MNTRIYIVTTAAHGVTKKNLVEAISARQAHHHVTATYTSVAIATPKQIAELMAKGVKLETAGEEGEQA